MAQTPKGKPLPQITDQTRPFWSAAKRRKLVMQKCSGCGTLNFYPKPLQRSKNQARGRTAPFFASAVRADALERRPSP